MEGLQKATQQDKERQDETRPGKAREEMLLAFQMEAWGRPPRPRPLAGEKISSGYQESIGKDSSRVLLPS